MMRAIPRSPKNIRWAFLPNAAWILALSALMAGCGLGARSDFDLNRGEAQDDGAKEAAVVRTFDSDPAVLEQGDWVYEIQEGDDLEVAFFTHPEQNRFVKVRPDGRVTLPYLGDIMARGKAPSELAAEIQERYAEVLVSPRVDVIVQTMGARYYVLGQVRLPGEYDYERRINLVQALASAGGYDSTARLSNIVLLRRDPESGEAFAAVFDFREFMGADSKAGNLELRPYDILWVPRDAVSRWDNAARKTFTGILNAEDVAIKGWSLVNFQDVFERQTFR